MSWSLSFLEEVNQLIHPIKTPSTTYLNYFSRVGREVNRGCGPSIIYSWKAMTWNVGDLCLGPF